MHTYVYIFYNIKDENLIFLKGTIIVRKHKHRQVMTI